LGYSHQILMDIPEGVKITVTDQTKVKVEGPDKQVVGAVTAEIRSYYPPEPYKGKGVRIVGEHAERVRRKEGKTVA
jgi:large subunit ribosomal protein L6